jgi:hypothetical protein
MWGSLEGSPSPVVRPPRAIHARLLRSWYNGFMDYKRMLLIGALVAAIAPPVSATTLLPGDLGDIARGAKAIVHGTVVDVRTEWVDGRRRVETIVTLEVSETFKGDMGGRLSFQVPGGVIGRYRSVTIGAPSFHLGEEVVLFLGAQPPALPYVLGLGQGVFRVRRDARTGDTTVTPPALLADRAHAVTVQRGDPARHAVSLPEFAATVRSALARATRDRESPERTSKGIRQH